MFKSKTDLSLRAERKLLQPASAEHFTELLTTEGDSDAWRIVEASSVNGRPFDLELTWSAANGSGSKARISVAHAARICLFARTIRVRACNQSSVGNAVGVTIADGYADTRNQLEVRSPPLQLGGQRAPTQIRIPAFARTAWVEAAEPDVDGLIQTYDGTGHLRGSTPLSKQPPKGVPVGGAGVLVIDIAVPFRVVFSLGI